MTQAQATENVVNKKIEKLSQFMFYFWLYTLLVILWGAWVRISHSGDGCGDHWPLCDGQLIPTFKHNKTWIEYLHRLMSGFYGLLALYSFFKIKAFPLTPLTQKLNRYLLGLTISEALLGAILVKGQLVTTNDSAIRLITMILHQLNSFLLSGVVFLIYLTLKNEPKQTKLKTYTPFIFFLLLAISGAIASLSTTLFPSISLFQGIMNDFSTNSHLFIRLRILHPLLALTIVLSFVAWLYSKQYSRVALEFLLALFIGVITLLTLSPTYLKLGHLLIAHLLWARLIHLFVSSPDSNNRYKN